MYQPSDFGRSNFARRKDRPPYSVTFEMPSTVELESMISVIKSMIPEGFVAEQIMSGGILPFLNASSSMSSSSFPIVTPRGGDGLNINSDNNNNVSGNILNAMTVAFQHFFQTNPSPVITGDDILRFIRGIQSSVTTSANTGIPSA